MSVGSTVGVFGGAFDPPHRGHVELARRAKEELGLGRLRVLVSVDPGHKSVDTPAEDRLELTRAAFPDDDVERDTHPRTVDTLRAHPEWRDPILLLGADQFSDFPSWKEPGKVLELARLAVATRPGFAREALEAVLGTLDRPERVLFFELDPVPISSRDLRRRLEAGEDVSADVPAAVADVIRTRHLYARQAGYTGRA
jgi:nicotinate-nucleotide adenylyltransferase